MDSTDRQETPLIKQSRRQTEPMNGKNGGQRTLDLPPPSTNIYWLQHQYRYHLLLASKIERIPREAR